MKLEIWLSFMAGFFVCGLVVFWFGVDFGGGVFTGLVVYNFSEVAPSNYFDERDIIVFDDEVCLRVVNASLSRYTDTGSMRPFLDKGANGIRVVPGDESEVSVGDIVSFRDEDGNLVAHRVVDKGWDSGGVWFLTKGDANLFGDSRVRFEDIEYKLVGILY